MDTALGSSLCTVLLGCCLGFAFYFVAVVDVVRLNFFGIMIIRDFYEEDIGIKSKQILLNFIT